MNGHHHHYGNNGNGNGGNLELEKEKKVREHLLDLRHELAEQIKERSRQAALNANAANNKNSDYYSAAANYHQQQGKKTLNI